jgi:DNA-directed RNA polymerase subunit RPC12/RpoP
MKKPIHKFNGGKGATLCTKCSAIINEGLTDDLLCKKCSGKSLHRYRLVRERDGLTNVGNTALWLEWNETGTFKEKYETPEKGRSLVLDFAYGNYVWMTTTITEIIERREDYIKFSTENSMYELFISDI